MLFSSWTLVWKDDFSENLKKILSTSKMSFGNTVELRLSERLLSETLIIRTRL